MRDCSSPLAIYAQNGANARRQSPARVRRRGGGSGLTWALDPSLTEVLSGGQAREAVDVWSAWRGGLVPSPEDRFMTVMFYAQDGASFPLESAQEGM